MGIKIDSLWEVLLYFVAKVCIVVLKYVYEEKIRGETMSIEKKRLTISLSQDVYNDLESISEKLGLNKSAMITTLILQNKEKKGA